MEKETLEEAKLRQLFKNRSNCYADSEDVIQAMDENCFIETINEWQQEQDKNKYSEEEVLDIINSFEKLCYTYQSNKDWFPAKKSEWFEKFKKK